MSLGKNILEARKARGLTQEALGERLGMSPQSVSKWERDECLPDAALLPKLADELEITLDRLFDRKIARFADAAAAARDWLLTLEGGERWREALRLGRIVQSVLMGVWEVPEFEDVITLELFDQPGSVTGVICSEEGFTFSDRRERLPFLLLFPEPKKGWGPCLSQDDPAFWEALAKPEVRRAVLKALAGELPECFDRAWALRHSGIEDPEATLEAMEKLGVLRSERVRVNGQQTLLWQPCRPLRLLAILLLSGAEPGRTWGFDSGRRRSPLVRTREDGE